MRAVVSEPYGEEAYLFSRDKCLQHDVEIEITGQDKIGTMIGTLWLHKKHYGVTLLSEGYARLSGRDSTDEVEQAQAFAQSKRLRTWETYDAEVESARAAAEALEAVEIAGPAEAEEVTVVEMRDAVNFYVHAGSAPKQLEYIGTRLAEMGKSGGDSFRAKVGDVVAAKFSQDGDWYRARVEAKKGDKYEVHFVDYGNADTVQQGDLLPLGSTVPSIVAVPPQAIEYKLAHIKLGKDEDMMYEAAGLVQDILGASRGKVRAKVEYRERSGRHHVTLMDPTTGENISSMLLRNGLAKLEKRKQDVEGLKDDQEVAKRAHLNLWRYGDAADSDDEDKFFAQDVAKARAAAKK